MRPASSANISMRFRWGGAAPFGLRRLSFRPVAVGPVYHFVPRSGDGITSRAEYVESQEIESMIDVLSK